MTARVSPKLLALLRLLAGKGDSKRAVEIAYLLWPDRPGRIPSGGGPDSLAVAMSYWLGRLRKQGIVGLSALRKDEVQSRYYLTPQGRKMLQEAEQAVLQQAAKDPRGYDD